MIKYILRRTLALPVIMLIVSIILFSLISKIPPEQRVSIYLPSYNPHITEDQYQELIQITIQRYGLDQPFHVQYLKWLTRFFQGDWGYSPAWHQTVLEGFKNRAPATIELTLFSIIPTLIFAILAGVYAAKHENRLEDQMIRGFTILFWAIPPFILGLILMNFLYAKLHFFPPERLSVWASRVITSDGYSQYTGFITIDALLNQNFNLFLDAIRHLILPGLCLSLVQWALYTRLMRSSLLDVLKQDYITTARSKGIEENIVTTIHAGRNAVIPFISVTSMSASLFLSNLMVIETLFNFNGICRWALRSALVYEIPVVSMFALVMCTVVVFSSLLADILYVIIDPRIRID